MAADYINIPLDCLLRDAEIFWNIVYSVPKDVETVVISYTVPVGKNFIVLGGSASGKTDADFKFYIDGNVQEVKRLAWTDRNVDFRFSKNVEEGKIIKISVEHDSLDIHDFEASIFGLLK